MPIFPVLIRGDVPFLSISGYSLAGKAESASSHLDECRTVGSFRTADLVPMQSPTAIVDELMASPEWDAITGKDPEVGRQVRDLLREQSIRSLQPLLPQLEAEAYTSASCCGGEVAAAIAWAKVLTAVAGAGIRWNQETQRFTAHAPTSPP